MYGLKYDTEQDFQHKEICTVGQRGFAAFKKKKHWKQVRIIISLIELPL